MKRKYKKTKIISHDVEFHTAALNKQAVVVYMVNGVDYPELFEEGGYIENINPETIKINGSYFMRKNCEFWI